MQPKRLASRGESGRFSAQSFSSVESRFRRSTKDVVAPDSGAPSPGRVGRRKGHRALVDTVASWLAQTPTLYPIQTLASSGTVGEAKATTGAATKAHFLRAKLFTGSRMSNRRVQRPDRFSLMFLFSSLILPQDLYVN
jgi:hypothetical protein